MSDALDGAVHRHAGLRLTYIIGTYPVLTETFIDREVRHLLDRGVDLRIVSIRRPRTELSEAQRALSRQVRYLLPVRAGRVAWAHLSTAARRPRTYFGTLGWLLTRKQTWRERFRSAQHFGAGVYAARVLRDRRGVHLHAHFIDRAATVALVAARLLDTTYSVTAHAREIYVDAFLLPERIGHAAFVATCTEYNRRHLERIAPHAADRIVRLYHGLDLGTYLALERDGTESAAHPLILSVGQLTDRKGLRYLIEACGVLAARGRGFRCEIVGDGPLAGELGAQIADLGLADHVRLTGPLPYPEVVARYSRAAVFSLPCVVADNGDRDGIPNVILEAMAARVPVVSTDVSGIPEVLRHEETGLVVPERDAVALADALARILDDRELAARVSDEARTFVASEFDLDRNIGRLLDRLSAAAAGGAVRT
jgi:colanic acid/amylovoran biosynthesis glycosyltransferase